ncbi:MAG: M1 family metallopeptidase [Steroidobacteraceae bacterium]
MTVIRHLAASAIALFAIDAQALDMGHSYANTTQFRTTHAALDLTADFDSKRLKGYVDLTFERVAPGAELILDTRDLSISSVHLQGSPPAALPFKLGKTDAILGTPLAITLPATLTAKSFILRIDYETSPGASGLQWLTPAQTAGKKQPFLYSQSQAIHARSWIPLQDTPQIRLTYSAHIRTPPQLLAVMSAGNDVDAKRDGDYSFDMPQAIPSYLFALGIGDLVFRPLGPRTGVFAEPVTADVAAREFSDVESMLTTCEKLFGPYRWGRYDMLILPPSFMWGGMENPRLTFVTPTVLAGDKSLVSLIAHELAHSWSGNLVTNGNWESAWLNEGFTTYLERRIVEVLYGADRRAMDDVLGLQSLRREIAELESKGDGQLTRLTPDLRGRDPDDNFGEIPYEKGRQFAGFLEARLGRERLDKFLRGYFDHFAFHSVTTQEFDKYLEANLLSQPGVDISKADIKEWLEGTGIPAIAVLPTSDAFDRVDVQRKAWFDGKTPATQLQVKGWNTQQWLQFLDNLPAETSAARLGELDAAFHFTAATNSEIVHSWLKNAIRAGYAPAWPRLEQFLTSIGRRRLVRDLYDELIKTPAGVVRAKAIYAKARPLYQVPLAQQLDDLFKPL